MPGHAHVTAGEAKQQSTYRGLPLDFVIDVRTRIEFWLGHLDGAICIQLDALAAQIAERPEINKNSRILLYCASGARSAAAAHLLRELEYTHVIDAGPMSSANLDYKAQ